MEVEAAGEAEAGVDLEGVGVGAGVEERLTIAHPLIPEHRNLAEHPDHLMMAETLMEMELVR